MSASDTIFALSSGGGRAGVAVVRVSGPNAGPALAALLTGSRLGGADSNSGTSSGGSSDGVSPAPATAPLQSVPTPRALQRANLFDAEGGLLDEGMAVWFPGPNSFTGEDVVELHVHGSPAVVRAVLARLGQLDGLRPAEAGEFTQRAFLRGKLDLAAVEGLGDLIDAQTEAQRRLSLRQLGGALSQQVEEWRSDIIALRAETEAWIDFPDEDLPEDFFPTTRARAGALAAEMASRTEASHRLAAQVRDGFSVALVGLPNVGKSSLLNALAARDVAIVTDIAGTTRDTISVPVDLGGFLVNFVDTAGLRETSDTIEALGVDRARQAAEQADLVLWLVDERGEAPEIAASLDQARVLRVATKQDLWRASPDTTGQQAAPLGVSVVTGEGLQAVLDAVQAAVLGQGGSLDALLPMGRERHAFHVGAAVAALQQAQAQDELALLAECMREASAALGRITGAVDVEDVLDHIFSRFCIGK